MDGIEFVTMRQAGIESDPAEDADTFEGNARIKALAAHEAGGGVAVLADDSGLVVDALDGAPGVYSSRFAGEDGNDAANNALLLERLKRDAPDDKRTARPRRHARCSSTRTEPRRSPLAPSKGG